MEGGPRGTGYADEGERPEKAARRMNPVRDIDERYAGMPVPEKGMVPTAG